MLSNDFRRVFRNPLTALNGDWSWENGRRQLGRWQLKPRSAVDGGRLSNIAPESSWGRFRGRRMLQSINQSFIYCAPIPSPLWEIISTLINQSGVIMSDSRRMTKRQTEPNKHLGQWVTRPIRHSIRSKKLYVTSNIVVLLTSWYPVSRWLRCVITRHSSVFILPHRLKSGFIVKGRSIVCVRRWLRRRSNI